MLKNFTLAALLILLSGIASAQTDSVAIVPKDTSWKKGGMISLAFNQTSLTNWAGGGQNALSLSGIGAFYLKYKKDRVAWDNNLDLAYGLIKQGDRDFEKNDDRIEFNSKLGYKFSQTSNLYYTALVNAKSQFTEGYNYPNDSVIISDFASPAYVLFSLGIDWKPTSYFSFFVSPFTSKLTFVNNQNLADAGAFGVDAAQYDPVSGLKTKDGSHLRSEFGAYVNARFQKEVMTNVGVLAKLDLFSNYSHNPGNIDVNFDLMIALKINKLITVNIGCTIIYDDDVMIKDGEQSPGVPKFGPRTQIKQTFGVGLLKKF